uniref:Uncharacterized protein n=1 Tax=Fagus sylvatica TaxID=28930 RepID=A0A2N9HB04_FAGSY
MASFSLNNHVWPQWPLSWTQWPRPGLHGLVWPQRPYPNLYGLVLASMASFGLVPASFGLRGLVRPYPGLYGLVRPQRPRLTSIVSSRPPRPYPRLRSASTAMFDPNGPCLGVHGLIWPQQPRLTFNGLVTALFGLNSLVRAQRPYLGLHGLVWPQRPSSRPPRPRLTSTTLVSASTASFGLKGPIPASTASSRPPRSRLASEAPFGPNGLIPASVALFDLNGHIWPLQSRLASTALSRPQRPLSALTVLSRPQRPLSALTALSQPPWPRSASTASFDLYGLVSASTTLSMASNSLVWPQRPYPSQHGLVRPHLASAAPFGPNDLISTSVASFGLNGHVRPLRSCSASTVSSWPLRPYQWPLTASFGLNSLIPGLYGLTMTPTASFNLVDSARLKDYPATLSSIIGRNLTPLRCKANPVSTSL